MSYLQNQINCPSKTVILSLIATCCCMVISHEEQYFNPSSGYVQAIDFEFSVRGVIPILDLEYYFNLVNRLGSSSVYILMYIRRHKLLVVNLNFPEL